LTLALGRTIPLRLGPRGPQHLEGVRLAAVLIHELDRTRRGRRRASEPSPDVPRWGRRTLFPGGPVYVWHCHILEHEDYEVMRPYVVQP